MNRTDLWEIRHPKKAGVVSSIKNCGYSDGTLASLRENGYSLYHNGQKILPKAQKGDVYGEKKRH